jgi:hypothetical protein
MRVSAMILAGALIGLPTLALADPTGTYSVTGHNAGGGGTYEGTVEVTRTGGTYKVVWTIAGKNTIGTGLGSHFENGNSIITGPATDNDAALSVGYVSKDSFGIAQYYLQADGSWSGVWTYGGSKDVATETWTKQ